MKNIFFSLTYKVDFNTDINGLAKYCNVLIIFLSLSTKSIRILATTCHSLSYLVSKYGLLVCKSTIWSEKYFFSLTCKVEDKNALKPIRIRWEMTNNLWSQILAMLCFEYILGAIHIWYPIFGGHFWPTYLPISDFLPI